MPNAEDIVRVLRVVEYKGARNWVERTVAQSIQGTRRIDDINTITSATVGTYPEILELARTVEDTDAKR